MANDDFRGFLRLLSDDELTTLRDQVKADILANRLLTSVSVNGKGETAQRDVSTTALAQQLFDVLKERSLQGASYVAPTRMTLATFS